MEKEEEEEEREESKEEEEEEMIGDGKQQRMSHVPEGKSELSLSWCDG